MFKTNRNFEKFEKHCKSFIHCVRHVGNDELNYLAIVNRMHITGVEISKKSKCAKKRSNFEKFENTLILLYTVCAMSEMMI